MNKKNLIFPAIVVYAIYALYGCVLAPLYQYLISDIVLSDTLWLDLVDLLYQYAEILGSAALLGFLCFSIYRYGFRGARPMLILMGGALAFKYLSTVVAVSVVFGSIDLTGELTVYLFAFLLELAIAAFAVFLTHHDVRPAVMRYQEKEKAAHTLGKKLEENDGCYPFKRLLDFKNPLQRTVFFSLLTVVAWRLIAAIMNEFAYGVALKAGDLPVILLYWALLILLPGFLGYLLSLLCIRISAKKAT